MAVRVTSDKFGIADRIKLTHHRIPFGCVYWLAFRIVTVELKNGSSLGTIVDCAPTESGDVFQCAIQQDAFRMGIVLAVIVWQSAKLRIVGESFEMAIYENVAMILFNIANPHESTITGDGTMVEERRTAP